MWLSTRLIAGMSDDFSPFTDDGQNSLQRFIPTKIGDSYGMTIMVLSGDENKYQLNAVGLVTKDGCTLQKFFSANDGLTDVSVPFACGAEYVDPAMDHLLMPDSKMPDVVSTYRTLYEQYNKETFRMTSSNGTCDSAARKCTVVIMVVDCASGRRESELSIFSRAFFAS